MKLLRKPRRSPDNELYFAIRDAERAVNHAYNLCYDGDGHGADFFLTARLGNCQSLLMHYVVKYAKGRPRYTPPYPQRRL